MNSTRNQAKKIWTDTPAARDTAKKSAFITKSNLGSVTIPYLLLVIALNAGGLFFLNMVRDWKKTAKLQIDLDRCVSIQAKNIKNNLEKVQSSNQRLLAEKVAYRLAITPELKLAIRKSMEFESRFQDAMKIQWQKIRIGLVGCRYPTDIWIPFDPFPWIRTPADDTGMGHLEWKHEKNRFLLIQKRFMRSAAVELIQDENKWKLKWTIPNLTILMASH